MGLEVGGGDMVWTSFALAPVHEELLLERRIMARTHMAL